MNKKTHVVVIHGGMTFKNRKDYLHYLKTRKISLEKRISWTGAYLDKKLGRKYEVIRPVMPLKENAKYEDWKIHFERFIPLLRNQSVLIGNSLGGIFLAQYLSENKFPKKIQAVFIICAPFDGTITNEDLDGGFRLGKDLSLLQKNASKLFLMFSKDDDIVPVAHAEKYRSKLPNAKIIIYKSKNGHFKVPKFPEIIKIIRGLRNK